MKNQMPNIPIINPLELHMIEKGRLKSLFTFTKKIKQQYKKEIPLQEYIKGNGQIFLKGTFDDFFREVI